MTMIQATFLHNYKWWQGKGFFLCDSFASVNRLIWLRRKPYRIGTKLLLNSWFFFFSFKCSGRVHFLLGVCEASNQNLYYIVIELSWQRLHWKVQCTDFASVSSKLDQRSPYCTKSLPAHPGRFKILASQKQIYQDGITSDEFWLRMSYLLLSTFFECVFRKFFLLYLFLQSFEFLQALNCLIGSFCIEDAMIYYWFCAIFLNWVRNSIAGSKIIYHRVYDINWVFVQALIVNDYSCFNFGLCGFRFFATCVFCVI